jgi:hypothetical protein
LNWPCSYFPNWDFSLFTIPSHHVKLFLSAFIPSFNCSSLFIRSKHLSELLISSYLIVNDKPSKSNLRVESKSDLCRKIKIFERAVQYFCSCSQNWTRSDHSENFGPAVRYLFQLVWLESKTQICEDFEQNQELVSLLTIRFDFTKFSVIGLSMKADQSFWVKEKTKSHSNVHRISEAIVHESILKDKFLQKYDFRCKSVLIPPLKLRNRFSIRTWSHFESKTISDCPWVAMKTFWYENLTFQLFKKKTKDNKIKSHFTSPFLWKQIRGVIDNDCIHWQKTANGKLDYLPGKIEKVGVQWVISLDQIIHSRYQMCETDSLWHLTL